LGKNGFLIEKYNYNLIGVKFDFFFKGLD